MSIPFWHDLAAGFHQKRCVVDGASNNALGFEVFIWRGDDSDSKVLLLNGATHGDEWEGPTALNLLGTSFRPEKLSGTIVVIPVLNESAFFTCRRESANDNKNLARVFPGNAEGSPTEKLAHAWQTQFITHASLYVDIHSAGAPHEIWPWAGYVMHEDTGVLQTQREMASCFPNMWHWGTPYLPGRTISAACENNVPAIYLELQGKGGVEKCDLEAIHEGIENILQTFGFVSGQSKYHAPTGLRESTLGTEGHLQIENPAPCDGILMQIIEAGTRVRQGDILAIVQPLDGSAPREVLAAQSGRAVMVRRFRAIKKNDALAVVVDI